MSEQSFQPLCAKCFHPETNHASLICNGSLTCMCEKYIAPYLYEFAQLIEKEKSERRSIMKRCEFILKHIPQTRNAGEKSFAKIYWEIWEGLKIRKNNPQALDSDTWKRLTPADTINREKRRSKQWNEELRTYDNKVIEKQTILFQTYMELAVETN